MPKKRRRQITTQERAREKRSLYWKLHSCHRPGCIHYAITSCCGWIGDESGQECRRPVCAIHVTTINAEIDLCCYCAVKGGYKRHRATPAPEPKQLIFFQIQKLSYERFTGRDE